MQTPAWCCWSPLHISSHPHQAGCYTTAWPMAQKPFLTWIPAHTMGLPLHMLWSLLIQTFFHFQVLGTPCSGWASIPWQASGLLHSSASQHISRWYRVSNNLHTKSMGMLSIHSSNSAIAMASWLFPQIKRHFCTLLHSWLMPEPCSMGLLLATCMGCGHYTLTWVCQTYSNVPFSCINFSGPYTFNLTQSLASWPSHMTCWYWPSPYTGFLHSKSCGLPWP